MKNLLFILAATLPLATFAQRNTVPPTPPTPPAPPALNAAPSLADTTKPMRLRTKKVEIIVDDKRTSQEKTQNPNDVQISTGNTQIIVRKRKKADGNPENEAQIGERRIVIKSEKDGSDTSRREVKIIRRKVDKNGDVTTIDGAEIKQGIEDVLDQLGKEIDKIGKEMDKLGDDLDKKGDKLDNLSTQLEKNKDNTAEKAKIEAEMKQIQAEMAELEAQMKPKSQKIEALGRKMAEQAGDLDDDDTDENNEGRKHKKHKKVEIHLGDNDNHHGDAVKVKNRFILFDFGVNGFTQNGNLNLTGDAAPLEIYYGKSFMYRIGAFRQRIPLDKKGIVNLSWGANFEMDNYEFAKPITLQKNTTPLAITTDNAASFSRNRLYTSWAEVPLMLQFETSRKASKSFRIGVGAQGGLMLGSLTDQCDNATDKSTKVESGFNLNKIRYGVQAQIGYGPVNFVAQYNLSPLFQAGTAPNINTFNIGFSVIPF